MHEKLKAPRAIRRSFLVLALLPSAGWADTILASGTFTTAEDVFQTTVVLTETGTLTLETYGFGGGVSLTGAVVPPGGFDPLVAVFLGAGDSAILLNGTSDGLSNYSGFAGCPPAGTRDIGTYTGQCGDISIAFSGLAAGPYTVILSDAEYIPNAFFDPGPDPTLGEGFTDLTSGSLPFQTCANLDNCVTDTANWALDITTPGQSAGAPEPAVVETVGLGLFALFGLRRKRR